MIAGSIYLTKQARKTYKKHQAEKAAQRLAEKVQVSDPSDEFGVKVPLEDCQISTISTPDTHSPRTVLYERHVAESPQFPSGLHSPRSQLSLATDSENAPESRKFEHFVRRQSNGYLYQIPEEPPSYDTAIASPAETQVQHIASPHDSHQPLALSATSAHLSWSSHDSLGAHCPTCFAIMQQYYAHHDSHTQDPHMDLRLTPEANVIHPSEDGLANRVISEMPDQSMYHYAQVARPSRTFTELPDTGRHQLEASIPHSSIPIVKLPAEMPEVVSKLTVTDFEGEARRTDGSDERGGACELPT